MVRIVDRQAEGKETNRQILDVVLGEGATNPMDG